MCKFLIFYIHNYRYQDRSISTKFKIIKDESVSVYNKIYPNSCLRNNAVAFFRLLTKHDCLSKHLKKIGIISSPFCSLCSLQEEMNQRIILSDVQPFPLKSLCVRNIGEQES